MRSGEKYSTLGVADHLYSEPDPDPFFLPRFKYWVNKKKSNFIWLPNSYLQLVFSGIFICNVK